MIIQPSNYHQNNRQTGSHFEQTAADYLKSLGFNILEMNYRIHIGEIDIIGQENDILCFIEVKYRRSLQYGRPAEAVTKSKQKTIIRVSDYYMKYQHPYQGIRRYDVIEIMPGKINLIRNAFGGY